VVTRYKSQPRYPAHKLLAQYPKDKNNGFLSDAFGVTRSTIIRWKKQHSTIALFEADKFAIKIGVHPQQVWEDWYDKQ